MDLRNAIEIVSNTDVGMKRTHNEDSVGTLDDLGLLVLADGMGGYKAGEVASAIAVNIITEEVAKRLPQTSLVNIDEESGLTDPSLLLKESVLLANETIFNTAQSQPQCQGMGTTLVSILFYDDKASFAHVGDSRAYRYRNERLEQMTIDHSLLQELVDKGFYTPEEARNSVQKNLVTRALGIENKVLCDVTEKDVLEGDIYLLCSDGLTDLVSDGEIHLTIDKYSANLEEVAQRLITQANDAGGKDNISIILARIIKPFPSVGQSNWYSKVINWFD